MTIIINEGANFTYTAEDTIKTLLVSRKYRHLLPGTRILITLGRKPAFYTLTHITKFPTKHKRKKKLRKRKPKYKLYLKHEFNVIGLPQR